MAEFPKFEEMAKNVAEQALDNFLYDGKSIREWMQIIVSEDCISRQAVIEVIRKCHCEEWVKAEIGAHIEVLSPVTPQPKMGHWEWNQYDANPKIGNFHCSLCHIIGRAYYDYCPGCGAEMSEIPTGAEGSGG